jgi:hypothetical protein
VHFRSIKKHDRLGASWAGPVPAAVRSVRYLTFPARKRSAIVGVIKGNDPYAHHRQHIGSSISSYCSRTHTRYRVLEEASRCNQNWPQSSLA